MSREEFAKAIELSGATYADVGAEAGCSREYIRLMAVGQRRITPGAALAVRRLRRRAIGDRLIELGVRVRDEAGQPGAERLKGRK